MKTQETKANAAQIGNTTEPTNLDRACEACEIIWSVEDELKALEYLIGLFQNENNFDVMKAPDNLEIIRGEGWKYITLTINHIRATLTQEADKLEKAFDLVNEIR